MPLIVDLPPDDEARLRAAAAERGLDVNQFATAILRREVQTDAAGVGTVSVKPRRDILEFEGIGAKYATGQDAQEYVNELRAEWDHRP